MTSDSSPRVLLVTADGALLVEEAGGGEAGVTVPVSLGLPTVNREAALMAGLRKRYGIGGRVAALVRTGAEAAPAYAYVVRVTHCPDASGLRPAEAGGLRGDEEVAALIRRAGGVRGVLTLPDLREEGEGQGPLTAVAVRAAGLAARAVRDVVASGRVEVAAKQGAHDLVTTADRAAEEAAIAEIRGHRPDDAILAEESGSHPGTSGVEWILDPVDGTGNFVLGRPDYAVSVAAYRDGVPLAAVIRRPADGAWAATGEHGPTGTLPLACRSTGSLAEAVVSVGVPHDPAKRPVSLRLMEHLLPRARDFRRIGSACCDQLAVATGTLDAYVGVDLGRWDYAAGIALVTAAGGVAEEIELAGGVPAVVAAAPGVAGELVAFLRSVPAARPAV
ncbi:inositol monophosphatase family protein [Streptomyces sp. NRRL S-1022]|uniref:inositol monophosphatase family protein n=1 Tax=Streptomyces sp. NRRL S-1022 TaxID=1463880 RepID=UPI00068CAA56|nr:inositol monophosphatase family protein [Streptomyces sp. NRRL S-1022]